MFLYLLLHSTETFIQTFSPSLYTVFLHGTAEAVFFFIKLSAKVFLWSILHKRNANKHVLLNCTHFTWPLKQLALLLPGSGSRLTMQWMCGYACLGKPGLYFPTLRAMINLRTCIFPLIDDIVYTAMPLHNDQPLKKLNSHEVTRQWWTETPFALYNQLWSLHKHTTDRKER
jgi:L-rhamnose mutarotase